MQPFNSVGALRRILTNNTSLLGLFANERARMIQQKWFDPIEKQKPQGRPTFNRHRRLANANGIGN